ncbi:hypothetical protein BST97_01650 [Nonlabens spongiae]|uniref:Protein-S-isoprenylcysteine methyltransferase n=1 Tax=Nonlabens spongiae TaxID=331648 RepID=A0A1W6MH20_9FLAO|nr:hypothetical protein BST97_01650 [Nonlabens spongiae]
MSGKRDLREYLFVFGQMVLFLVYPLPLRWIGISFPSVLNWAGLLLVIIGVLFIVIALVQLNIYLSPFPSPVKDSSLITSGIFKISRHPIYAGIILTCLGYGLFSSSIFKIGTAIAIGLLLYYKSKYEEALLMENFPEYQNYRMSTRRFI